MQPARPLAEALVGGGFRVLEVTLRTGAALKTIREMKKVVGTIFGAGTVIKERVLRDCIYDRTEFIVSPGLTNSLGNVALDADISFLPGIANAGDIMRGLVPLLCVGGSWLANGDHTAIQQKASTASSFG